jgi:hypothetical protein
MTKGSKKLLLTLNTDGDGEGGEEYMIPSVPVLICVSVSDLSICVSGGFPMFGR